ncbi:hypothetical protein DAU66_20210 [Salmonella enterica subsp. enterica serovar Enteritidis]|nr:hypothetical protein [Salmonella enterica subsp. enterica serovar Enteritidis]EEC4304177.1 hypothetical protein [Salmonella enterica subsp. enterica serovar Enteritidis]EEN2406601.1 hypothetical protein [Salmonella enterica subsp. enterica serovar Enteritidis]EHX2410636.1 hypothetical protein [Salmonella enterica subsp. enterica serovar Enteritidis]
MNEDKLYQALNLWVELTGIDPNGKSFAMGFSKSHSSWDIKKMHDQLKESQQLDSSGITTYYAFLNHKSMNGERIWIC